MVFPIVDSKDALHILLVKAECKEEAEKQVALSETQKFVGSLTDNEIDVLHTSNFAIVCS